MDPLAIENTRARGFCFLGILPQPDFAWEKERVTTGDGNGWKLGSQDLQLFLRQNVTIRCSVLKVESMGDNML